MQTLRFVITLLLLVTAAASAHAQMGGGRGHRQPDQQQQQGPKKSSVTPGAVVIPEVWPRLDEGAVLCRAREDLVKYQRQLADSSGGTVPEGAACRLIRKQTGIDVLDRDGPSRSQVVTTDAAKETGWTNAYLPSTPPASVLKGASAGK